MWSSWVAAIGWTLGLALIDGWQAGVAARLTTTDEYLHDLGKVADIPTMLRTFSDHILTDQSVFWTTHVGAHPPGVFRLFVCLERLGLGGGGNVVGELAGSVVERPARRNPGAAP